MMNLIKLTSLNSDLSNSINRSFIRNRRTSFCRPLVETLEVAAPRSYSLIHLRNTQVLLVVSRAGIALCCLTNQPSTHV